MKKLDFPTARHLLARTGFDPRGPEVKALVGRDPKRAVEAIVRSIPKSKILAPPTWHNNTPANARKRGLENKKKMMELSRDERKRARRKMRREIQRDRAMDLKLWWFNQMFQTSTPAAEKLVLFWHNHFTSSLQKVKSPVLMWRQHQLFRKHASGSFKDLLLEVSQDPAMILYLDNQTNRRAKPNENFARELLELFTLGEGNYSERDIKEAARAFTGWKVNRIDGTFVIRQGQQDKGQKTFMGQTGNLKGEDIIEILLKNPRVSHMIVEKFWKEYVSREILVKKELAAIAKVFRQSDYNIGAMLKALWTTPTFLSPAVRGTQIKSPVHLAVGVVRVLGLELADPKPLLAASRRLGQDIFNPPNVKGWPGHTLWISSDTLLMRQRMLHGSLKNPMHYKELWRYGYKALRPDKPTAKAVEALLLPSLKPVYEAQDLVEEPFEFVRSLVLDPAYQLC